MAKQMNIRIDPETKNRLNKLAKLEGKSTSQKVRDLIEDYVKTHDISDYITDLWNRIGNKLRNKGTKIDEIPEVIRNLRENKNASGN